METWNRDLFSRHLTLVGEAGLELLREASVVVAGAGGLGSTLLELLVRLGVGEIHIYDDGIIDLPDLNRQLLYTQNDLGKQKVEVAKQRLGGINPATRIEAHAVRLSADIDFGAPRVVVDCLDNFATRFVLDDATYDTGIPLIHGGVYSYFGQITTIHRDHTPPLRALFGDDTIALDDEAEKPVFPPAVVGTATIEATECTKLIIGRPAEELLYNRILSVDYTTYSFDEISLSR